MTSHHQRSHITPHFNSLCLRNVMVPLIMPSTSCNGNGDSCMTNTDIQTFMLVCHHIYMHTGTHQYTHTFILVCIHTYIHINMHAYSCMSGYTYTCIHKHTYLHAVDIHTYIHAYIHRYVQHMDMCVCTHTFIHK